MNSENGSSSLREYAFAIFKKDSTGSPIWIETVIGLDRAKARLLSLAASSAGDYLVYDPQTSAFLDLHRDTGTDLHAKAKSNSA